MSDVQAADWFNAAETRKVMAALEAVRADCARFVGGCIRNTLMDRPVDDIDIATQLKPEETLKALKTAGIRAIPTGIEHGTITAVCNHIPFEITSLRRDVETDGRRAVVAFTEDWAEDAQRRDFRLNALYADSKGQIHDPTGGLADIAERRIIFIGDAQTRLREDHLRNLRFFRFTAWYGKAIDPAGLAACAALKDGLKQIAAERIWKEFAKLLAAPDPFDAVYAMAGAGVLDVILPQSEGVERLRCLRTIEWDSNLTADAMQRFMALLPRDRAVLSSVAADLRMSRAERGRLVDFAKADLLPDLTDARALKRWIYTVSPEVARDVLWWVMADQDLDPLELGPAIELVMNWTPPTFPVKGADLVAQGTPPGPELGRKLRALETAWIENDFSLDGLNA